MKKILWKIWWCRNSQRRNWRCRKVVDAK